MNLFQAINQAAAGRTIVSNIGNVYRPQVFHPIYCNAHSAIFTTAGTTEYERKGKWRLDGGSTE